MRHAGRKICGIHGNNVKTPLEDDFFMGNFLNFVSGNVSDPDEFDFPGHLPVFFLFRWARLQQQYQAIRRPRLLPRPLLELVIRGLHAWGD